MVAMYRKRKPTLLPLVALAGLGLVAAVPVLSETSVHAASVQRFSSVTVHPGDSLWGIAAAHTSADGDVQATIDEIIVTNHLRGASIVPGQQLRIPD